MRVRTYYTLAKPGIIYGNLFVALGAYFMASGLDISITTLFGLLVGLSAIIGSAGALNNYFDRDIDSKMERTKLRPSVTGEVSGAAMVAYSMCLVLGGTALLYFFVNPAATIAALLGWFGYIVLYTLLTKRDSVWGTFVGGFSGSMPPVIGYAAVTGSFDTVALVLFLMLFFWQMPHAYAISLFRLKDYQATGIQVLPVARSIARTKYEILIYALLFAFTAPFLYLLEAAGIYYTIATTATSLYWLFVIKKYWRSDEIAVFGKKVFLTSLIVLMVSFLMMGINSTAH